MERQEFIDTMAKVTDGWNAIAGMATDNLRSEEEQFIVTCAVQASPWEEYLNLLECMVFGVEDKILQTAIFDYDGFFPMQFDAKDFWSLEETIIVDSWGDLFDKLVY